MKNLVILACGRAAFGDVFGQNQLVAFQLADLALIRADDGLAVRVHDAIKKLADLLFHGGGFQLERRAAFFCVFGAAVPQIAEHGGGQLHKLACGRERAHKGFEGRFHLRPRYRLAVAGAALLAAHIIGITTAFALGPCGGHGMVAIAASDKTPHRKIRVDVLARRRAGFARKTVLNTIKGL